MSRAARPQAGRPPGAHPANPGRGRRGGPPAVPRTRVRGHHDRGDQRALRHSRSRPCTGCSPPSSGSSRPCSTSRSPATTRRSRWRTGRRSVPCVANPDPRDTLTGFAALVGGLMARTAPVHRVLEEAARSDQGAAEALAEIAQQRHDGQRRITRSLARQVRCVRGSRSATRPTSSTRSPLPRSTACSSPTAAGAANGTSNGLRRSSSISSCPPPRKVRKPWNDATVMPPSAERVPGGVVHQLPADLRDALIANPTALAAWKDITPLARNEFICWVDDAKQDSTRHAASAAPRRNSKTASAGPAAGPDASTASATASSAPDIGS